MQRSLISVIVLCSLLLNSCKKDSPVSPSTPEFLLPLKLGNSWILRTSVSDTMGTELYAFNDSIVVFKDTVIVNDCWFLTNYGNNAFANRGDGVWTARFDSNPFTGEFFFTTPVLLFKYPSNEGDQWNVKSDTSSWSLSSKSAGISVPQGMHTCYLYRYSQNRPYTEHEDYYVEPGTGIIAIKTYSTTSSAREYLSQSSVLLSYKLL